MSDRISVPQFELIGPPCESEGCKGVLVDYVTVDVKEYFQKCSVCHQEFGRMSVQDKLDWALRTIERAVKGQKSD